MILTPIMLHSTDTESQAPRAEFLGLISLLSIAYISCHLAVVRVLGISFEHQPCANLVEHFMARNLSCLWRFSQLLIESMQ